jgi:TPR repeat protein
LFLQSAKQGCKLASFALFSMYGEGRGVPEDRAEAAKWLLIAGSQGYEDAYQQFARYTKEIPLPEAIEAARRAAQAKALIAKPNIGRTPQ